MHRWHDPFRIVKKLSPVNFQLRNSANRLVSATVHFNRLKPYYDPKDRPVEPPDVDDDSHFSLDEADLPPASFE